MNSQNRTVRKILNFLYPNACPLCGEFLLPEELLCEECAEKMLISQDNYCHNCGKAFCICEEKKLFYERAVIACRYSKDTRRAVIAMKKAVNTNFAYFSAEILAKRLQHGSYYEIQKTDFVMPVPMHRKKQRMRGYNQAALIARHLAELLQIPYREDVLYKMQDSVEQHSLHSAKERAENVGAFQARAVSLDGKRILLCDDVLTTGSTLNRCAELLKQCGAESVTIASASMTISEPKEKEIN